MKKISGKQLALAWVVALFICIIASLGLNQTLGRIACSIVWIGWFGLALWWGAGVIGILDVPNESAQPAQTSQPAQSAQTPQPAQPSTLPTYQQAIQSSQTPQSLAQRADYEKQKELEAKGQGEPSEEFFEREKNE